MVKVKNSAKAKAKPRADQCVSTIKKCRPGNTASKKVDMVLSCCDCGVVIDDDTKAVQCEKCVGGETWKCASCLDLSDELYEQLATSPKSNFHWFCDKCEVIVLDAGISDCEKIAPLFDKLHSKTDNIEQRLMDTLAKFEQNLMGKVSAVEQTMLKKADNEVLRSVEERLRRTEDKPVISEESQQRLEQKLDQIRSNMDEPVVQAVQEALQEDKAEEAEIERRKSNVIVHGVPESVADMQTSGKTMTSQC